MIISPAISTASLQTIIAFLHDALAAGESIDSAIVALQREVDKRLTPQPVEKCPVCGALLQEVAVNTSPANQVDGPYTRAVVCINRPRKDQPWLQSHCGWVEYR